MNEPSDKRAALLRVSRSVGLFGSLALHGLIVALVAWAPPLPDVDFELELPSEVDFGVPEAAELVEPPAPTEPVLPAPAPAQPTPSDAPTPKPKPKGLDAGTPEPDAAVADAAVEDAGKKPEPVAAPKPAATPKLAAFAPKGSQINIRLDIEQIRASPLSEDVRLLLIDAPDFRAVVEGSGIDAVRDLDRLFLASPDLRRANVVIAGQHTSQPQLPQRAVAALATANSKPARWKTRGNISVAPWLNRDDTERVVALLASDQFVISPTKDLGRVLAVARSMSGDKALDDAGKSALLALPDGVAGVLTVYDARRFARGNLRGVPMQLEVVTRLSPDGGVTATIRGQFETEDAADSAVEYWSRTRERFASHPLVALVGMRTPLISASIKREHRDIVIEGALSQQQARTLLGFARSTFAPPPIPPVPAKPPPPPPLPPALPR
jgi:outer membrane biosynthesis protein TonB